MSIAIPVFGGLGLFLYGMNIMGTGLQKTAGNRLKKVVEVLTRNRLMAVLVGALVTMVIQSSSATTVMVVGFVNAGIMDLTQAVGVIMGANIGTTVTAQLIAFNLTDYAPLAVVVGMLLMFMSSSKKGKDLSDVFIGFGILFIGMDMMSNGLGPLAESKVFTDIITKLNNPLLAALVGLGLTTVLQSSSASIGLLQALASQGLINMNIAFPILFGENIGTTTTALISSIGANITAKRAAVIHFLFNLVGTILFMTVLRSPIQRLVVYASPDNISRQIANAHTLFNLLNVVIQFPFANLLVKAVEKLVPGELEKEGEAKYLDERILETPSIALSLALKETSRMSEVVETNMLESMSAFTENEFHKVEEVYEREAVIDKLEKEIADYILQLTDKPLAPEQHAQINDLISILNDLERIGDHSDNIAELAELKERDSVEFSEDAKDGIVEMFGKAKQVFDMASEAFATDNKNMALEALKIEEEVNRLEEKYRSQHIMRLNEGTCTTSAGVLYLDALNNIERMSDHASNICRYVLKH